MYKVKITLQTAKVACSLRGRCQPNLQTLANYSPSSNEFVKCATQTSCQQLQDTALILKANFLQF